MKPTLLTLAFIGLLPARTVDLSSPWRVQAGDNPDYAKPSLDDSAWSTVDLPLRTTLPANISWLRKTVAVPQGLEDATLVLGVLSPCYTVFVNGARSGAKGCAVGPLSPIPLALRLPPSQPDGRITIALRVVRRAADFRDEGPYALTGAKDANWQVELGRVLAVQQANLWGLLTYTQFLIALLLIAVWFANRGRIELLWFGVAILGFAVFNALGVAARYGAGVPLILGQSVIWAIFCLNLGMSYVANGQRLETWKTLVLAAGLAATAWEQLSDLLWFDHVLLIGFCLPVFWSLRSLRRGTLEQRVLACGMLLYVAASAAIPLTGRAWTLFLGPFAVRMAVVINVAMGLAATFALLRGLFKDQREKDRLAREMDAGRDVQQLLLPSPQTVEGATIDATYLPAAEVGGDFWQTFPAAGGAQLVAVGDVSGKGLKAAMLVSLMAGALRNRKSDQPGALLAELNRVAVESLKGGFVTALVARIESGAVTIANAGHPSPYLDGAELALDPGLPLGIDPQATYAESKLPLNGMLTFVSDGVIEAANAKGELFGFDRTREISTRPAQEIAEAAKAWGQNDDITVVTVRRSG